MGNLVWFGVSAVAAALGYAMGYLDAIDYPGDDCEGCDGD